MYARGLKCPCVSVRIGITLSITGIFVLYSTEFKG
jgi:hypothetical protein